MYLPFGENFTKDTGGLSSSALKIKTCYALSVIEHSLQLYSSKVGYREKSSNFKLGYILFIHHLGFQAVGRRVVGTNSSGRGFWIFNPLILIHCNPTFCLQLLKNVNTEVARNFRSLYTRRLFSTLENQFANVTSQEHWRPSFHGMKHSSCTAKERNLLSHALFCNQWPHLGENSILPLS